MQKIKLALGSRTFWTILVTIVLNTVNANSQFLSPQVLDLLNVFLGLATTYFHVNPSQAYSVNK